MSKKFLKNSQKTILKDIRKKTFLKYSAETSRMGEQVDKEEIEKNFMIKTVLDNLHRTDRDLEDTVIDAVDAEKLKREELAQRQV